ncbi:LuxR C-terminal-related transcriptional regulator [Actinomadura nitritigenes]|uniref:LuxR C-terminal-related transcriptional regulator n=1 Tax=Actinomadura nitritigenes TaxID=134602 RepID=UPI003D939643
MARQPAARRPIFDRERECKRITDLLARGDGPRIVLVEGDPGTGRTHLLEWAARTAEDEGFSVFTGTAHMLGRPLTLEPLPSARGDALPARSLSPGIAGQPVLPAAEVSEALAKSSRTAPLLLVLDDLQWADPATIAALCTPPAGSASTDRVCWLMARCGGLGGPAPGQLFDHLRAAGAVSLTLRPLADDAVLDLVTDTLGARPDPELLRLAGQANGNALLLVELVEGLLAEDGMTVVRGCAELAASWPPERLPERIHTLVQRRLDLLDPAVRQLLKVTALVGPAFNPRLAADLLGMTPAELLPRVEAAVASGFLVAREDTLAYQQDLVRRAVATRIPGPVRRALHVQIGTVLLDRGGHGEAAAAHLMAGAVRGDQQVVAALDRAVEQMLPTTARTAADVARRALDLTGPADPLRPARTLQTAGVLCSAGELAEALELADIGLRDCGSGAAAAETLTFMSFLHLCMGRNALALETAGAALEVADLPEDLRDRAELAVLRAAAEGPGLPGVLARSRSIITLDAGAGPALTAGAFTVLALHAWDEGRLADGLEYARTAARRVADAPVRICHLHPGLVLAAMLADARHSAEAQRTLTLHAREAGGPGRFGWTVGHAILRSRMRLAEGRPAEALREARDALAAAEKADAHPLIRAARSALSMAALRSGEPGEAVHHRGDGHGMAGSTHEDGRGTLIDAQMTEARDGPRAAMRVLGLFYDGLPEHTSALTSDPSAAAWLVRTALAAGETASAEDVVAAADRLAGNPGFPSLAAGAAQARGLLFGDRESLRAAVADHVDPWARGSAAEDLGVLLNSKRAGRADAVRWFDQALSCYQESGSARDTARVRGRLRKLGERRRHWQRSDGPATGWASLTETERRISGHVAQGLTNQRIADQMFVSVHTVAFHLRQVFRKLGIGSRVELARLFLQHSDEPDAGERDDLPT